MNFIKAFKLNIIPMFELMNEKSDQGYKSIYSFQFLFLSNCNINIEVVVANIFNEQNHYSKYD